MTAAKYYVGVIVDSGSVIAESNESNNSGAAGSMTNVK
jgi:subtilase family serine protease